MNHAILGTKLRCLRESKGLTQERLAELVKARQSTISDIELGRRVPSFRLLLALAGALNVSLGEFDIQTPEPEYA